ncbi:MAG: hypothetical protein IIC88_04875 [Chloroflexi bacterium]|nr:hypothetical protein [Chloroflexota bacterium]
MSTSLRPAARARQTLAGLALVGLAGLGLLLVATSIASANLTPGTDVLDVSGQVSVTSLLGSETIPLSGTVTIQRSSAQIQGVYIIDAEIIAMDLAGTSVTGPIAVVESATLVSPGEIRGLQPAPAKFPASSFFDAFIVVSLPASPTATVTRRNEVPLHLVPMSGGSEVSLSEWPPLGVTYEAVPTPCVPLIPILPQNICVTSLSITITGGPPTATPIPLPTATPDPVGGIAELAEVAGTPLEAVGSSGVSTGVLASLAAAMAIAIALGGAAWYARRR